MADKDVGEGKEFPTAWHKETYITNLHRELEGAVTRGDDDYAKTVKGELARFEKKPPAKEKAAK